MEKVILTEEVKVHNPGFLAGVEQQLPDIPIEFVTYTEFKSRTAHARAAVHTGDFVSYANVILVSGILF